MYERGDYCGFSRLGNGENVGSVEFEDLDYKMFLQNLKPQKTSYALVVYHDNGESEMLGYDINDLPPEARVAVENFTVNRKTKRKRISREVSVGGNTKPSSSRGSLFLSEEDVPSQRTLRYRARNKNKGILTIWDIAQSGRIKGSPATRKASGGSRRRSIMRLGSEQNQLIEYEDNSYKNCLISTSPGLDDLHHDRGDLDFTDSKYGELVGVFGGGTKLGRSNTRSKDGDRFLRLEYNQGSDFQDVGGENCNCVVDSEHSKESDFNDDNGSDGDRYVEREYNRGNNLQDVGEENCNLVVESEHGEEESEFNDEESSDGDRFVKRKHNRWNNFQDVGEYSDHVVESEHGKESKFREEEIDFNDLTEDYIAYLDLLDMEGENEAEVSETTSDVVVLNEDLNFDRNSTPFVSSRPTHMKDVLSRCVCEDCVASRSQFKKELIEILEKPYDSKQHQDLKHEVECKRPILKDIDRYGKTKPPPSKRKLGKSYLALYTDFANLIDLAKNDNHKSLNLLRGFFFWLENISRDDAFKPWVDPSVLEVLPRK